MEIIQESVDPTFDAFLALRKASYITDVLEYLDSLSPGKYWVSGGALLKTVWNYQENQELSLGINDLDIAYFDTDSGLEFEDALQRDLNDRFKLPYPIETANQNRVHEWANCPRYLNLHDAVSRYYCQCVGCSVTSISGELIFMSPFPVDDFINKIMVRNKDCYQATDAWLYKKIASYKRFIPNITFVDYQSVAIG